MRIVFSDLDGTLLSSTKEVPARTVAALDELARRGIEFVPCSGRPLTGLPAPLLAHPAVHYAVCANGAVVCRLGEVDPTAALGELPPSEVIHREDMEADSVVALYEALADRDVLFDVFGDGNVYEERFRYERMDRFGLDPHFLPQMRRMRKPVDVTIPELLPSLAHIERVSVYWRDPADRERAIEAVGRDPRLAWVSSLPMNVEVSCREASKGAALTWLCAELGIPVAESVAFGDGLNDVSMLEVAGDGVAMADGSEDAKAAADHICEGNDAPGVALYLERLLASA